MENVTLNNGVKMPILGFGVYLIKDAAECEQSVTDALEAGYRSIDTAAIYGNEEAVGNAIKKSRIPRKELFITTKLWISDAGEEKAMKAFEKSMKLLQLDYLDLYLIHQPCGDIYGSWRTMEKLYKEERIRAIGVSNFYADRLEDLIIHNEVVPAVNQIETHPFFQRADYQSWMEKKGVQIESWGPLAQGRNDIFTNKILTDIAQKHGKTVSQTVLRWLIQRGVVVIPKSTHKQRIIENFNVFDFKLTDEEMKMISALDTDKPLNFDHRTPEAVDWLCSL